MRPVLLPKSEIDRLKGVEKKKEIDEGLKLARRVDSLRETTATEEVAFSKYRSETLASIQSEIFQRKAEVEDLDREIFSKKEWLKEADVPLEEKRRGLSEKETALDLRGDDLDEKERALRDLGRQAEIDSSKATGLLARANTAEEVAKERLAEAESMAKEAEKTLSTANKVKSEAVAFKEKTHTELTRRDIIATGRERDLGLREEKARFERQKISEEWKILRDRQAMFERNLKRTQI